MHWVYSVKVDEFDDVTRYKTRLVGQGRRQVQGVDVDELFAPTNSFGARTKTAEENLVVHQVDRQKCISHW